MAMVSFIRAADSVISHTPPEVSIIILTHNEGDWLRRTVRGVIESTQYPSYEILVVDDGSNDGSTEFLRVGNKSEIEVRWVTGQNLGVAGGRAMGASYAHGKNLVFLDAHVLPDPGWLMEIMDMLSDPTVGIAGIGVRDVNNPDYLGYAYVPANENLNAAWSIPQGPSPFEVPAVIGCCFGMRRAVYDAIGGFDPGSVGWGVDDIELSLRAWFMGYRCLCSSAAQVAHWFKDLDDRSYAVSWEDYDVNLLRCAFTYFEGPRLSAILCNAAGRDSFKASLARVHADTSYWQRRAWIRERFRHDEDWYFNRFASELAPLNRRLQKVLNGHRRSGLMKVQQNTTCPSCGATNVGVQEKCLICGAMLPASDAVRIVQSRGEPSSVGPSCSNCGADLKPGNRFCTKCGTPVAG